MFKRVIYEDWATIVPLISFTLTFAVFAFSTIRALCISKSKREKLAQIPLES
jgi:hypothetical protein